MRIGLGLTIIFWLYGGILQAQTVVGKFSKNSIKIGETITYTLICQHTPQTNILFPDSSYDFSPFEYVSHSFSPTLTQEGTSTDKVEYLLTTFETEQPLSLSLPIFVLSKGEKKPLFAEKETINLETVFNPETDESKLKTNTDFVAIPLGFDYYFWGIVASVFLGIIGITALLFGKKIMRYIKLRKMKKAHLKFILALDTYFDNPDNEQLEHGLALWKSYLAKLVKQPISSYTSKEITALFREKELRTALLTIDKKLYGGIEDNTFKQSLSYLKDVAIKQYEEARNKV